MNILYTTKATSTGGRDGKGASEDGRVSVKLDTPKELGGGGGPGTNPEQLFGIGYAACFIGALKFVAGKEKVKIADDSSVTATVGIGPRDDGKGFGLGRGACHPHPRPGQGEGRRSDAQGACRVPLFGSHAQQSESAPQRRLTKLVYQTCLTVRQTAR